MGAAREGSGALPWLFGLLTAALPAILLAVLAAVLASLLHLFAALFEHLLGLVQLFIIEQVADIQDHGGALAFDLCFKLQHLVELIVDILAVGIGVGHHFAKLLALLAHLSAQGTDRIAVFFQHIADLVALFVGQLQFIGDPHQMARVGEVAGAVTASGASLGHDGSGKQYQAGGEKSQGHNEQLSGG